MEITYFYKHLSKEEEVRFRDYLNEKLPMIENLLTHFADDAKLLKASIEKYEKHDAFCVELILALPNQRIVAKETSHALNKAVDLAKDRLKSQLKKHLDHLRKSRDHGSIRTMSADVLAEELSNV
jgi:ribosomal subunit interface protein